MFSIECLKGKNENATSKGNMLNPYLDASPKFAANLPDDFS
jgi:hypothetical protein